MEFIGTRHKKKRKRKRALISNKSRRRRQRVDAIKCEVKYARHQKIAVTTPASSSNNNEQQSFTCKKIEPSSSNSPYAMEASAFWENYDAAHEWQKKHNVTWWKTRCFALEHENHILRETIRRLRQHPEADITSFPQPCQNMQSQQVHQTFESAYMDDDDNEHIEDDLQFCMNEDMMNFLAQSIQHKKELQNQKEANKDTLAANNEDQTKIDIGVNRISNKLKDARLLYGEASSKILGMETALQTTIDRHKDKTKPQYWPNIPLRL
ncbi:gem-associated protein 8-like [Trichogramma pretiosum]|uniref:gem-associated protein 8-like n=1 Tax=Trichogramma pretiosum TaxID=7493 RepID=UPI0006C9D355|nr:gem-associated protein 8-like [Trichogramma pretiosum]